MVCERRRLLHYFQEYRRRLKYLLAILNSNLYFFWLYFRGKRKGEMLELYQQPLSEIPVSRLRQANRTCSLNSWIEYWPQKSMM